MQGRRRGAQAARQPSFGWQCLCSSVGPTCLPRYALARMLRLRILSVRRVGRRESMGQSKRRAFGRVSEGPKAGPPCLPPDTRPTDTRP